MNAIIVQVKIDANREEEMRTVLNHEVVPTARQLPGFASGTWLQAVEGDLAARHPEVRGLPSSPASTWKASSPSGGISRVLTKPLGNAAARHEPTRVHLLQILQLWTANRASTFSTPENPDRFPFALGSRYVTTPKWPAVITCPGLRACDQRRPGQVCQAARKTLAPDRRVRHNRRLPRAPGAY